ncbi:ATP-binding protein [Rathayibacter sp. SD072]|uniref:ATP-binding protein n=1 Tax=Rathayibacter sp. SD072 TaxID=2781731 RepID=UPI001A9571A1|nr:ATP-binding protein [Rathayibacter sp. SD072]MBO0982291.1 ATP-binding protein [Rathayibacter sp. SD072]
MPERSVIVRTAEDGLEDVHSALEELWAEAPELGSWDRMAFTTAVVELATNVLQHGRGPRDVVCRIDLGLDEHEMRAVLEDAGDAVGIDVADPRAMPDEWAEAGRGIPFIQALVTRFEHQRVDGRNVWTIVRERKRS